MASDRQRRVQVSEVRSLSEGTPREPSEEAKWRMGLLDEPHPAPEKGCVRRGLCCKSNPGWFAPGEVEAAAALLHMEVDDFVRTCLVFDRHEPEDGSEPLHVFVPVKLGRDGKPLRKPATVVDRLYKMFPSPCIFYTGEGCRIYAARPMECQRYLCTRPADENLSHEELARMWREG